ncbi:HPP family protein, partial [Acinetobacter baumannii]|uniref:HPP family protein n=1 Tax=Acinetobacter baumannii TaxID=470 RepID=UPI0033174544
GAAALTAVIGSQGIHAAGYGFAFAPVGINSVALVSIAMFFHRATARTYPHVHAVVPAAAGIVTTELQAPGLHMADIDAALGDMHESFDIS